MAILYSARYINIQDQHDPLSCLTKLFVPWFVRDRSCEFLNSKSSFYTDASIDLGLNEALKITEEKTIETLMDETAVKYISTGSPITVSWSGGVDSTALVVALLKNNIDPEQLTILCASSSLKEYPIFYKYLIDNKYRVIESNEVNAQYNRIKQGYILTGWGADQLFGSNIHLKNSTLYHLPWQDAFRKYTKEQSIFIEKQGECINLYEEWTKQRGFNITSWSEFTWYYNFMCKFTHVAEVTKLSIIDPELRDKTISFFATEDFQAYSIQHFNDINKVNVIERKKFYKRPLKEYIYIFLY